MRSHLLSALTFFIVGLSCTLAANALSYIMLAKVNSKLPEDGKISYVGFYLEKNLRITREYCHLYPSGLLHIWIRVLFGIAIASILACAWQLGFFSFFTHSV